MTETAGCPIRDLLLLSPDTMKDIAREEMLQSADVSKVRLAWGFVGSEATKTVGSVLNEDVFEIVAQGWCTARCLHDYTDEKKHPPGERSIVHLAEHSFVKIIHPVLDIYLGPEKCASLRFTLELAANFRAVALSICDKRIVATDSGDGDVSATLKYGAATLHRKESRRVHFPGHVDIKAPGLEIG